VIYALWSGVCLRLYLRRRFGRPDSDYAGYILIELGLIGAAAWPGLLPAVWMAGSRSLAQLSVIALVSNLGAWILAYPLGRLVLWPTARLVGDPRGRAGFSWRAMGGWAIWNYLFARVMVGVPQVLLQMGLTVLMVQTRAGASLGRTVPAVVAGVMVSGVLTCGLHAAAYRQRLGPATREVGEVFA
jgi:hypothetical protein